MTITRDAVLIGAMLLFALLALPASAPVHTEERDPGAAAERERSVARDTADVAARLRLAEVYESQGRLNEAIEQYEAAIRLTTPSTSEGREARRRLRYAIATRHAERAELDAALHIFEELIAEYPDNAVILYSAGVAYLLKGRMSDARSAFEKVIKQNPGYVNAYLNLASVDEAQGLLSSAIDNLRKVIEIDPESVAATRAGIRLNIIEGQLLAEQGDIQEAIAFFKRVVETEPSNRAALISLADLYRRSQDEDAELDINQKIVAAYPDDMSTRLRLAAMYVSYARYRDAYQQLEPVIELGPASAFAGQAQMLLGRIRNTDVGRRIEQEKNLANIGVLQERLREIPGDLSTWKELGMLQFQQNDHAGAAHSFEQAMNLDPEDKQTRYALAAVYDNMGRFADSVNEYAILISVETDARIIERVVPALQLVNAKSLYIAGKFPAAIREFNEILSRSPNNDVAHFYIGLIYSQEEEVARAVDAYKEVIRIVPTHVGARLNLAASYERLNREEAAIDEYNKILQANPSPQLMELARTGLANAQSRIRGFSMSFGYLLAYDSNTNLSRDAATEDVRSDLSFNFAYQYKMENSLRWRFLMAPVYSNYHQGQYDYLNTTLTISAALTPGSYTLVGGYTNRTSEGLVANSRLGRSDTLFGETYTRIKLPALLHPFGGERVFSNVSFSASYSDFVADDSPFFSAYTTAAGISFSQPESERRILRLGYQAVLNSNKELVGNDYAYRSHGINVGLDQRMPWGVVNLNYGFTWFNFVNADSFSQFTRRRENFRHNIALGASRRFQRGVTLFTTLSWAHNRSNLPVGFVLSSEDIIEGLQSSSLSDYSRFMLTTGMTLNF